MSRAGPVRGGSLTPTAEFEAAVRAAVMQSGGWNRESRLRVSALAAAMGKNDSDLRRALAAMGSGGISIPASAVVAPITPAAATVAPRAAEAAVPEPAAHARPAPSGSRRAVMAVVLILMVLAVFVMSRALAIKRGGARQHAAPAPVAAPSQPVSAASSAAPAVQSAPAEMEVPLPSASAAVTPRPVIEPGPRVPVVPPQAVARRTGGVLSRWEAAALGLRGEGAGMSAEENLDLAIRLARMNSAALLAWRGEQKAAEAMIDDAAMPVASGQDREEQPGRVRDADVDDGNDASEAESLTSPGNGEDGQLALLIIAARRQPGAAVDSLARRRFGHDRLGPADCDAVAECALFGSPLDLRLACKKIAIDQRGNPAMVHALLEALPRAAAQSHVAEIIAQVCGRTLPSPSDSAWPVAARGALVASLAELLSTDALRLDELASGLMLAYAEDGSGAASLSADEAARRDDAVALERQAQRRWEGWRDAAAKQGAERAVLSAVEKMASRRDLRLMLAAGPMQRFVAWQLSMIDVMSFIVEHEQPSLAERTGAVVAEGARRVRNSKDAASQVAECERTMMRLWLLRVGSPEESSGSIGGGA